MALAILAEVDRNSNCGENKGNAECGTSEQSSPNWKNPMISIWWKLDDFKFSVEWVEGRKLRKNEGFPDFFTPSPEDVDCVIHKKGLVFKTTP